MYLRIACFCPIISEALAYKDSRLGLTQGLWAWIKKSHSLTVWQMNGEDLKAKMKMKNKVPIWGSDSKESACNAGDSGSIPGSGRSPGEGNSYLLQFSCLENSMNRGAWRAKSPWGPKESDTVEQITLSISLFLSCVIGFCTARFRAGDLFNLVAQGSKVEAVFLLWFPVSEAMQSIFSSTIRFEVFTSILKFNRRGCWWYLSMEGMSRNFGVSFTTLYTWVGIAYRDEQHKSGRVFVGRMSQIRFRNFKSEQSVWFLVGHNVQKFCSPLELRMDIRTEVKLWENAFEILSHESDEIIHRPL